MAQRVIDRAVQLFGGNGVRVGVKVEALYREIRALRIYEAHLASIRLHFRAQAATHGEVHEQMVAHAERHARDQGVHSLYLLTTTAEKFFLRRGYARIPREVAPAAIKTTSEFSGICPTSSAFMVKYL